MVKVYKDHGISGAKGREKRPQFDALHRDANARQFDVVMAWSVDRLGRSLQDLVEFLTNLHALKIDLFLKTQGIDTTTPAGKALFQMMGVFAEFERAMIQERVRAGLRRAKDVFPFFADRDELATNIMFTELRIETGDCNDSAAYAVHASQGRFGASGGRVTWSFHLGRARSNAY